LRGLGVIIISNHMCPAAVDLQGTFLGSSGRNGGTLWIELQSDLDWQYMAQGKGYLGKRAKGLCFGSTYFDQLCDFFDRGREDLK
jgi:hypothetical protein